MEIEVPQVCVPVRVLTGTGYCHAPTVPIHISVVETEKSLMAVQ